MYTVLYSVLFYTAWYSVFYTILTIINMCSGWICTSRKESDWNKAQYCDATYLSNNLVSPVWFHSSLANIPENSIVVEIAACGLLQSILKRALPTCSILPLMKRKDPKCVEFFLNSIGKLWNWGINPSFSKFYEAPSLPLVGLHPPPPSPLPPSPLLHPRF